MAIVSMLVLLAALPLRADSLDARFLEGLRERRLFELAEMHCRERLQSAPAGSAQEAELTLELIRTLALHAAHSVPEACNVLWTKARQSAADFLRGRSPRAHLVRVQDALTPLAQGELARQEFEVGSLPAAGVEAAKSALREATGLLEAIDKELAREVPLRRRTPPLSGELTADELFGLHQDVQRQLARAQRNRALLAERGSDDRRAMLVAAIDTLSHPLAQLADDEPLRWSLELDQAECQRLLGEPAVASELAQALDQPGLAPAIRLRARAERIRAALARKDATAAVEVLAAGRTIDGQAAADLDFARFEAFLALAAASPASQAKKYQEQAADSAKMLEHVHGPYWGRRANQLLIAALPRGAGGNLELLTRRAESLFLKQDWDAAVAAYDEASSAARTAGDLPRAFDRAYQAALIEQQRGRHAQAANRLRILAKGLAAHPQAPTAHLLAAWNAGQPAGSDLPAADSYAELLREHVAIWPGGESAGQARLWLGKLTQSRGDLPAAIAAYSGVARGSPHYPAAIAGLADCWRERLAKLAAAGEPTAEPAADAIRAFSAALLVSEDRLPQTWTEAERTAALTYAELILAYDPAQAAAAEKALRAALAAGGDAPAEWRMAAQSQLVLALAGQKGREGEAAELVRQISAASPAQLLALASGLTLIAERTTSETRPAIAAAQLVVVQLLAPSRQRLEPAQQLAVGQIEAEALAAAGRRAEAVAAYARLAAANPDSAPIQEGYAALLLDSTDQAQLRQALDHWRIVASKSKPRTPRWFRAKHSVALAQFKLGDRAAAQALLRYVMETPPGLKGGEWAAKFTELLRQCESP